MGLILALRQCKIPPKNIPKIYLKRVFRELILGVWGLILEPFWGYGRGLAPKGVLGGILGGSRAVLDPNMAPTWVPRWPQVGAKIAPKTTPKLIILWIPFKMRF